MNAQHQPWGFNEVLLVSLEDANLFCRPGNAAVVVNADPVAFFFTDTADVYNTNSDAQMHQQRATNVQQQLFNLFANWYGTE